LVQESFEAIKIKYHKYFRKSTLCKLSGRVFITRRYVDILKEYYLDRVSFGCRMKMIVSIIELREVFLYGK